MSANAQSTDDNWFPSRASLVPPIRRMARVSATDFSGRTDLLPASTSITLVGARLAVSGWRGRA